MSKPQRRLYHDDSLLLQFSATVEEIVDMRGHHALRLDASAFYPEAGGQLADRGVARWAVEDGTVQQSNIVDAHDKDGDVYHLLAMGQTAPPVGSGLEITIDASWRRQRMSQHTGQHMLSRALLDMLEGETISSRLGENHCTIDTQLTEMNNDEQAALEKRVNEVILEDRPVSIMWPDAEQLKTLTLRRPPKVTDGIRVIRIEDFDVAACGGTHVTRTGQIGLLKITQVERYKGGLRITFKTGMNALGDYEKKHRIAGILTDALTCSVSDLPEAIAKLQQSLREAKQGSKHLQAMLVNAWRTEFLQSTPEDDHGIRWVRAVFDNSSPTRQADISTLRALAGSLCDVENTVAMLATLTPEGVHVIIERHDTLERINAGALFRAVAETCEGRGGGRPDRAEGRMPLGCDIKTAMDHARQTATS